MKIEILTLRQFFGINLYHIVELNLHCRFSRPACPLKKKKYSFLTDANNNLKFCCQSICCQCADVCIILHKSESLTNKSFCRSVMYTSNVVISPTEPSQHQRVSFLLMFSHPYFQSAKSKFLVYRPFVSVPWVNHWS